MNGELFDEIPGHPQAPLEAWMVLQKGRMEAMRADPTPRRAIAEDMLGHALVPNSYDNTQARETMLFVNELLAKGFTPKDASKLALNTFPPPTKREAKRIKVGELPTASDIAISEESTLLELMETGRTYTAPQLLELLPRDHRVWQKKTTRGKFSATGTIMANLVTLGKVEKLKDRHALYMKRKESKTAPNKGLMATAEDSRPTPVADC